MVQRGRQPRLAFETFPVCFFGDKFFRQDLDDDSAAEFGVNRFIDCSLTARTELLENLVIPQCCSYHRIVAFDLFNSQPSLHRNPVGISCADAVWALCLFTACGPMRSVPPRGSGWVTVPF